MSRFRTHTRPATLILASLMLAAACTGAAPTTPPSAAPTTPPTAAPTAVPTSAPTSPPSAAPSASASDGSTGDVARGMGWSGFDPCTLLGEDAIATVVGVLDGDPASDAGATGGKRCTWTGADRGTLTIETADPETFEGLREAAYEPQDVPGLGSGAYWSQTGANGKLVVHGGAVVLLIEASGGRDVAENAARAMLAVLEVL
jgi:hypothetical protein